MEKFMIVKLAIGGVAIVLIAGAIGFACGSYHTRFDRDDFRKGYEQQMMQNGQQRIPRGNVNTQQQQQGRMQQNQNPPMDDEVVPSAMPKVSANVDAEMNTAVDVNVPAVQ